MGVADELRKLQELRQAGALSDAEFAQAKASLLAQLPAAGARQGKRPIGKVCPSCGSADFTPCKPEGSVAFTSDHKCQACGTRYRVPTPRWAAGVFVLAGLPMLVIGAGAFILLMNAPDFNPCGLAFFGSLAVMGGVATRHGLRALLRPGRV